MDGPLTLSLSFYLPFTTYHLLFLQDALIMVVRYQEILTLITTIGDDENIRVTVKESLKGGLITGIAATIGGLILGPLGLAVGGTVGGISAYLASEEYRKISDVIIYDMPKVDQERLVRAITNIVNELDVHDAIELIAVVQGNSLIKAKIMSEMATFFKHQLDMQIEGPQGALL